MPLSPGQKGAGVVAGLLAAASVAAPWIARFEGWRTVGYHDPAPGAYATICAGHMQAGVVGQRYSDEQCQALLAQDAVKAGLEISRCLKVDVPTSSRAAFISFTMNEGGGAFCGSQIAAKVNAGDLAGACREINTSDEGKPQWIYVCKGSGPTRVCTALPGLATRRAFERARCEEGLKP